MAQYGESIDDAYEMSIPVSPRDYGTVNDEDRQNEIAPLAITSLEYDNLFESRIYSGYDNNFELNSGHLDIPTGCQPDNSHLSLDFLGSSPGDQREDTNQMEQYGTLLPGPTSQFHNTLIPSFEHHGTNNQIYSNISPSTGIYPLSLPRQQPPWEHNMGLGTQPLSWECYTGSPTILSGQGTAEDTYSCPHEFGNIMDQNTFELTQTVAQPYPLCDQTRVPQQERVKTDYEKHVTTPTIAPKPEKPSARSDNDAILNEEVNLKPRLKRGRQKRRLN